MKTELANTGALRYYTADGKDDTVKLAEVAKAREKEHAEGLAVGLDRVESLKIKHKRTETTKTSKGQS